MDHGITHDGLFAECEVLDNFRGLCGLRTETRTRTCKLVIGDPRWKGLSLSTGVDPYGTGVQSHPIFWPGDTITNVPLYSTFSLWEWFLLNSVRVVVTCTLFTQWNAELLIAFLCTVLSACMARYWLSVPLWWIQIVFLNWYWLLISWHFLSPKRIFYFNVDKEASVYGDEIPRPPTGAPPLYPAGGLPSPRLSAMSPNRGDRSTPMGLFISR